MHSLHIPRRRYEWLDGLVAIGAIWFVAIWIVGFIDFVKWLAQWWSELQ